MSMNCGNLPECLKWAEQMRPQVGIYYRPMGDQPVEIEADTPMIAASVIKIPIMAAAFRSMIDGDLTEDEVFEIRPEAKMPSCGALTYMHDGLKVTAMDLITLMIILSDNTATNMLIDRLGIDYIQGVVGSLGIEGVVLRRKLFDAEKSRQGIQNTITARGIGEMLVRMVENRLLGAPWDGKMLEIMQDQRLNGKLPFYLHSMDVEIAHKTGEDDGITHDVGVIYAEKPFVLCVLSNGVDVPAVERHMQDTALELYKLNNG